MADKMIQVNDGTDNLYPVCSPVVSATLSGTYITSGTLRWAQSGKLVVFSARFTPKQAISQSVGELTATTPLPTPAIGGGFFCRNTSTGEISVKYAYITSVGGLYPIGQYSANILYDVSGAYISV